MSRTSHVSQPNVPDDLRSFSLRFWAVLIATGVGAGLGAIALMSLLRFVQHISYNYHSGKFLSGVIQTSSQHRVIVLSLAGIITGSAWFLLRRSGKPPDLVESIWEKAGEMPFVKTAINSVTQMVAVAMGVSLGREGAPKDVGGSIASKLSDWSGLSSSERKLLVACGAGAGLAGVYNVPVGGALFALEVLLGTISLPLVIPVLAACLIATFVSWLGLPDAYVYGVQVARLDASQIVWAVAAGPIIGVIGVGYVRLIAWAKTHKPSGVVVIPTITITFLVLGLVATTYPQLLGNGRDMAQLAFVGALSLPVLVVLSILKPLASAACLRSGASGGLLTPTLSTGAVLGGTLGHIWLLVWPGSNVSIANFAVFGAGALLAATMQAPLAAGVLMLEFTGTTASLTVPLFLTIAGATVVARLLDDRSIYSAPLHLDDAPSKKESGQS